MNMKLNKKKNDCIIDDLMSINFKGSGGRFTVHPYTVKFTVHVNFHGGVHRESTPITTGPDQDRIPKQRRPNRRIDQHR